MQAVARQKQQMDDYMSLARSFGRALEAQNRTSATIRVYEEGVRQFGTFLTSQGMPMVVASITAEHIREFLNDLLKRRSASTAATRYQGIRAFFKWAFEEGEITDNPMSRVKQPAIPEQTIPMLTDAEVSRLLKVCEGKDFMARRDTAIIRLLFDSGMRRAELAGIMLRREETHIERGQQVKHEFSDLDLTRNVVHVMGKGRRPRAVPFGKKTAQAIDRYLRVRDQHRHGDDDALWIGPPGALKDSAIALVLDRRAKQAGLGRIHAHMFRHGAAHSWLAQGGQEGDLMMIIGWRSRTMLQHYGAAAAADRALEAHRRLSPGDRL